MYILLSCQTQGLNFKVFVSQLIQFEIDNLSPEYLRPTCIIFVN